MDQLIEKEELYEQESIKKWMSRIKWAPNYEFVIKDFINYLRENHEEYHKATPDQLIETQLALPKREEYEILDLVQDYVRDKETRYGTKNTYYKQLRSFFLHNRAGLPRDPAFNIRGDKAPVNGHLSPEEVRAVLLSSNKLHRAIFLTMLQAGLDRDMLTYWNTHGWDSLHKQLTQNKDPIKLELPGRKSMKHQRPYYSFITSDAITAIRDYLNNARPKTLERCRDRDPDYTVPQAIFITQRGDPVTGIGISSYWKRHMKKVGNIEHISAEDTGVKPSAIRYGKNLHELRDTFKTLCSKSDMKYEVSEFFLGHTVDPLGYDKAYLDETYYRRQYMEASEFLNILTETRAYGLVIEEEAKEKEIDELKEQVEAQQKQIDKLLKAFYEANKPEN